MGTHCAIWGWAAAAICLLKYAYIELFEGKKDCGPFIPMPRAKRYSIPAFIWNLTHRYGAV